MEDRRNRRWKLEQVLEKQKLRQEKVYGQLFEECIVALGDGTRILSNEMSENVYDLLQNLYPFTSWSSIDWEKVRFKRVVDDVAEMEHFLNKQYGQVNAEDVFVIWSYGDFPVVQTRLHKIVDSLEDVLAVSSDTYVLFPSKFVVEFHHEGKITIGQIAE
ncbi:hypothetical protein KP806_11320 [Paenibacillus sp. N4]|uniref:CDI toxin immunity protein n=1 Tax=Paenibacillus vietnamensis TaxID=2590547 RepID=UPI001CD17834|nr:hypothetical protein [Paenibacillus vietnamensis]MCA0755645.1 hypothetical protein [Paenibacillus vietnamensis]